MCTNIFHPLSRTLALRFVNHIFFTNLGVSVFSCFCVSAFPCLGNGYRRERLRVADQQDRGPEGNSGSKVCNYEHGMLAEPYIHPAKCDLQGQQPACQQQQLAALAFLLKCFLFESWLYLQAPPH
jgi:hypothetical protein